MVRFINRKYELDLLEKAWRFNSANFIVIYGRRRIGKTRLISEFIKDKEGIFFIAEDTNKKVQIGELKNKIASYFNDDFLKKAEINEWNDLFDYLTKVIPKTKRFYLAIDEFSYLIKNYPGITSAFQKFWDLFLSDTKTCFLVSGSLFGLMNDKVLSSTSPLYGRRTRDMLIRQMKLRDALKFIEMPFLERLKVYMCIGGVPEYLLKTGTYENALDFFTDEFFKKDGYFYREPYFLLSQEFKEIKTYFTILNAIAYGNTRPTEISNFLGLKSREIYPYLENLIRLGFIRRITPIIGNKKAGIYLINDVFFDFWFNFVFRNREDIETDRVKIDENRINIYFGKSFESICREEFIPQKIKFERIGRWWWKDREIDIVALNEKEKEILFMECKWKELKEKDVRDIIEVLKEKSEYVNWNNDKREEFYGIIAREIENKEILRKKGYVVFDLQDFEKAFR